MNLRPPVNFFGSKARMAHKIIAHFPNHHTFVDLFGGSGAVLLSKAPARVEIYNDIDRQLVNFYQVVRDPQQLEKLIAALGLTLHSRLEFELASHPATEPVESARRFLVRQGQSYGALGNNWNYSVQNSSGGISSSVRRWRAALERLRPAHQRLRGVHIECDDWRNVVRRFDTEQKLFFADPPYLKSTRVGGQYTYEMTDSGHQELVETLLQIKGRAVVCGYRNVIYEPLIDAGWASLDFQVRAFVSDCRSERTETLWISPAQNRSTSIKDSAKPDVTPDYEKTGKQKMADNARKTHQLRTSTTARKVQAAIEELRILGKPVTQLAVAQRAGISRVQIGRRYGELLRQP